MELLGYNFLVKTFGLEVLEPIRCALRGSGSVYEREIGEKRIFETYPARRCGEATWQAQLSFAVKNEGINLEVLSALFKVLPEEELVAYCQEQQVSLTHRRVWFFYEWLTGKELPIPALTKGNYGMALDEKLHLTLPKEAYVRARRQRLYNNLLGVSGICPMVRRTKRLDAFLKIDFEKKIKAALNAFPAEVLYRANQYLYVKETKSSFEIERLTPDQRRIEAFCSLLRESGKGELSKSNLVTWQNRIVDARYAEDDIRKTQVYVGESITPSHEIVHCVGVKPQDLDVLMEAYVALGQHLLASPIHPVLAATILSFVFVFIHPFEDGNGRLHRYLLHHVLAAKQFTPEGLVFPISATLLHNRPRYDRLLENFSRRLMPLVDYHLNYHGEMTINNETVQHYRYIDFTQIVEGVFELLDETLQKELTPELEHLQRFDEAFKALRNIVDMPDQRATLLVRLTLENGGSLSHRKRNLFEELTDDEIDAINSAISKRFAK